MIRHTHDQLSESTKHYLNHSINENSGSADIIGESTNFVETIFNRDYIEESNYNPYIGTQRFLMEDPEEDWTEEDIRRLEEIERRLKELLGPNGDGSTGDGGTGDGGTGDGGTGDGGTGDGGTGGDNPIFPPVKHPLFDPYGPYSGPLELPKPKWEHPWWLPHVTYTPTPYSPDRPGDLGLEWRFPF